MERSQQEKRLTIGSYDRSSLILLQCLTPVHAGSGRGESSAVDMPVQKDSFGYPTIFSSSLKGAIRKGEENEIYGNGEFAGAFTALDAKLLLIPVRSLFGVYCLATSPFLLKSFKNYLKMCGTRTKVPSLEPLLSSLKDKPDFPMLITGESGKKKFGVSFSSDNKHYAILADEFKLEISTLNEIEPFATEIGFGGGIGTGQSYEDDRWRIAVVSDDLLRNNLVNRSMITNTRIKMEGGTAKQNALWTEESLPEKTLLYSVFFYSKSRGLSNFSSSQVQQKIEGSLIGGYAMFGGHETTGRGITRVSKVT